MFSHLNFFYSCSEREFGKKYVTSHANLFLPTYEGLWSCVFVENVENCTYFVIITYFIIQSFITYRELMSTYLSPRNGETLHKVPLY